MMFLFNVGFTAFENFTRRAKGKTIEEHPAIKNLLVVAMTFDEMMISKEFKGMLNSEAVEVMSRRLWGTIRAFDNVLELAHWKKPVSGETGGGKDWKSLVNWSLLEKIDVVVAGKDKLRIPAPEEGIWKMSKNDALREKHLPTGSSGYGMGLPGF